MKTNKKGISLIVLVITIIVMIILATAIILTLNNGNIPSRANEAKQSNDLASKKEAAILYLSEYKLKVADGSIDETQITADAYVRAELIKSGLDPYNIAVAENGSVLAGVAALFVNNKVEIGTDINGYKIDGVENYITSGNENTAKINPNTNKYEETGPQSDDNVKRDEEIIWKYFGIDENGNALIAGSVTSTSAEMCLAGKGGYIYGPQELNKACKEMYSSAMGTARSININDVTRVLEYIGERGSYRNRSYVYRPLENPRTINDLVKEFGYNMNNIKSLTPEANKKIGEYYTNSFIISLEKEDLAVINEERIDLIYPKKENLILTKTYWLADNSVTADFGDGYIYFNMRCVYGTKVSGFGLFISEGTNRKPHICYPPSCPA